MRQYPLAAPPRATTLVTVTAAIHFDDIGMRFPDGTEALRGIDVTVDGGEFVTIVGPSGCGKSTLLRIAAGLLEATTGTVRLSDHRLGYVFQEPTLMPWRTVRGNVEFFGELHDVPKAQRRRDAARAIELVGLTGFEDHYPKSLSGGMKMRCSLARSLTLRPPIMMFDEPFGAVDEITRERLNEETLRLFHQERFAGLFITHSVAEAVFMSTRVLVMSARPGRIVAEHVVPFGPDRPQELRFEPEFAALCGAVSRSLRQDDADRDNADG